MENTATNTGKVSRTSLSIHMYIYTLFPSHHRSAPLPAGVVAETSLSVSNKLQQRRESMEQLYKVQRLLRKLQVQPQKGGGRFDAGSVAGMGLRARVRSQSNTRVKVAGGGTLFF